MAERGVIEIHTSDRQTYKRCRRKFGWASTLRDNLVMLGPDRDNFFIGTGFHFALEDWWGYRRWERPELAFAAYYDAHKPSELPEDAEGDLELVTGMLGYYIDEWLPQYPEPYKTLWVDGKPQVEIEVAIELNDLIEEELNERNRESLVSPRFNGYMLDFLQDNEILYVTTYDRVVIDRHERILGKDYKTAKEFDELNLQTNPQSAAYNWSMDLYYTRLGYTVDGIVWQQHRKRVPDMPRLVGVGTAKEGFSQDKRQMTTYQLYKRALKEHYGTIPEAYLGFLAELGNRQDERGDAFVRRETLRLNEDMRRAEERKIVQEVLEMLDPDLPLYPNPTIQCSYDCPFKAPCIALDDGSDYQHLLDSEYTPWQGYKDDWRKRLKLPEPTVVATT